MINKNIIKIVITEKVQVNPRLQELEISKDYKRDLDKDKTNSNLGGRIFFSKINLNTLKLIISSKIEILNFI